MRLIGAGDLDRMAKALPENYAATRTFDPDAPVSSDAPIWEPYAQFEPSRKLIGKLYRDHPRFEAHREDFAWLVFSAAKDAIAERVV